MKILYAAGDRDGSYLQLKRYLPLFQSSHHEWKISGYKTSLKELSADWFLDAMLDFRDRSGPVNFNGNFAYYGREVAKFAPDLIISDVDIYTSLIAIELKTRLWHISPALLHYALYHETLKAFKSMKFLGSLYKVHSEITKAHYIRSVIAHAEKNLVASHLADIPFPPELQPGFEWIRPEFNLDDKYNAEAESRSTMMELADNFYNSRFSMIDYHVADIETSTAVAASIHYGLGQFRARTKPSKPIEVNLSENVPFLMELLK